MRRFALLLLAVTAASTSQAVMAADLRVKAPVKAVPVAVAAYNWSGFYLGVNAGYGWGRNEDVVVAETSTLAPFNGGLFLSGTWPGFGAFGSRNVRGGFGGLQFGYNWQAGNFVYGLEADAQLAGIKGNSNATLPYIVAPNTISVATSGNLDSFATIRGRVGFAFDRSLIYVTGGVAFGMVKYNFAMTDTLGFISSGSWNSKSTGWALGAGWEFALPQQWMGMPQQWTLKAEYQYLDFGSSRGAAPETLAGAATSFAVITNATSQFHTIRLGLNYRFAS
jgi:outer membrane immunogenic protein